MNRHLTLVTLTFSTLLSFQFQMASAQTTGGKPKTANPPVAQPQASAPVPAAAVKTNANSEQAFMKTYTEVPDTAIENRLVELALAGPDVRASNHQNKISELDLKKAKGTWLNLLTISGNYNDQTFAKQAAPINGQTAVVYPKFFFGITIPLGIIFSQSTLVKQARESVAYGKEQQEIQFRKIRADILSKYKQYKNATAVLEMQSEMINDVLANSAQAESAFKKGSISVDVYISAQKVRNDEMAKNMNLKLQQDLIKLELERIIGVPLEEVLHPGRNSR
ncbi:TolC family protein [Flavitalea flava]